MSKVSKMKKVSKAPQPSAALNPARIRLPGLLVTEEIGMGDAIQHLTSSVGIKPCCGCEGRAAALNRWIVFSR